MLNIEEKVFKTAPSCLLERVCLSGDMSCSCFCLEEKGDYLMVQASEIFSTPACPYSKKDEDENIAAYKCSCPVRMEIYRKYGK